MACWIRNASWVEPDGDLRTGSILIQNGRIANLSDHPPPAGSGRSINAAGCLIYPGVIDTHTHLREPGQRYKEGISNGTAAALKGGVTTVLDMPNNNPPTGDAQRVAAKRERFQRKSRVNWGFYVEGSVRTGEIDRKTIAGIKIYMSQSNRSPAVNDLAILQRLFRRYPRIAVHAEDEAAILSQHPNTRSGRSSGALFAHHRRRPREAIRLALSKIQRAYCSLLPSFRPRLILCHVSTADEVDWLTEMKRNGYDVWGETCPHYMLFTREHYVACGTMLQVNPPLRTATDRDRIRRAVKDGVIDFIATDHAPHTRREKALISSSPSGIASIEWFLPLVLQLAEELGWSRRRVGELTCQAAAKCFAIPDRNGIREGNYADLVMVAEVKNEADRAGLERIITRAGVNPYRELALRQYVKTALVNGKVAWRAGHTGQGRYGREVYS